MHPLPASRASSKIPRRKIYIFGFTFLLIAKGGIHMNITLDDGRTELWQWDAVGCGSNNIMIKDEEWA